MANRYPRLTRTFPLYGELELDMRKWQYLCIFYQRVIEQKSRADDAIREAMKITEDHVRKIRIFFSNKYPKLLSIEPAEHGRSQLGTWISTLLAEIELEINKSDAKNRKIKINRKLKLNKYGHGRRQNEISKAIDKCREWISLGRITDALHLMKKADLSLGAYRTVTERERKLTRSSLASLFIEVQMQNSVDIENLRKIVRLADSITAAEEDVLPELLGRVCANAAAAARMIGPEMLRKSISLYERGIILTERYVHHESSDRPMLLRWLNGQMATPLTITGDYKAATSALSEAERYIDKTDRTTVIEAALVRVRLAMVQGAQKEAENYMQEYKIGENEGKTWIQGWVPRYIFDLEVGHLPTGSSSVGCSSRNLRLSSQCATAWEKNYQPRYGFQLVLILVRFASLGLNREEEIVFRNLHGVIYRQMYYYNNDHVHRGRQGKSSVDCLQCAKTDSLSQKIICALSLREERAWRFYI